MNITRKKFLAILMKIKDVKQIGLTQTKTIVVLDLGTFTKVTRYVGYLNTDYRKAYKRKTGQHIEPMKRSWGERVEGTPLVKHNDKHYLSVKVVRKSASFFLNAKGQVVTDLETLKKIIATKRERDEAIKLRDFSLETISRFTISGKTYDIKSI